MSTHASWSRLALVAACAALGACAAKGGTKAAPAAEFYKSPDPATAALPFSEAVRAGDFLFPAGQIGNVPGKLELAPGGIQAEARQAMQNIDAILKRHGSSLAAAVKCTVFLADMKEWPAFNDVYREFFPDHFPARSAFGANGLARGARVEVECIAYAPR
jgi:reactive intermediate/imine deaminase